VVGFGAAALAGRRGFRVHATLEGPALDSFLVSRSRRFWLLVPEDASARAGVSVGERCTFVISPDRSPERAR